MYCPSCDGRLTDERYESVTVSVCPRCRSYWLESGQFLEILGRREKLFAHAEVGRVLTGEGKDPVGPARRRRRLKCPTCARELQEVLHPFSTRVAVDRCPRGCGLYLDEDELEHLQILFESVEDQAEDYLLKSSLKHPSRESLSEVEAFARQTALWHRVLQAMRESLRRRVLDGG